MNECVARRPRAEERRDRCKEAERRGVRSEGADLEGAEPRGPSRKALAEGSDPRVPSEGREPRGPSKGGRAEAGDRSGLAEPTHAQADK
jgi:hypothetical protein